MRLTDLDGMEHLEMCMAIHATMSDIQKRIADSFDAQGLMATIGAKLAKVSDGEVQIALPFSERIFQQHGYVHAGAITSIVDSACGYAALTKAPEAARLSQPNSRSISYGLPLETTSWL